MMRNRPGRSVTSTVPSGSQVRPHGCSSDSTSVAGRGVGDWARTADSLGADEEAGSGGGVSEGTESEGIASEGAVADEVQPTSAKLTIKVLSMCREQFLTLAITRSRSN